MKQELVEACKKCNKGHYWFRPCGVKEPKDKYNGVPWSRVYKRYPWLKEDSAV